MTENSHIDIESPSTPPYLRVSTEDMKAYLGVKARQSVYRAVNDKRIPPPIEPGVWTVDQVRQWTIQRGRDANIQALADKLATGRGNCFDKALAALS